MILLSTLSELAFGLESDLQDSADWGRNLLADFNAGKTQLVSFQWSSNSGAIDMKMDGSVFKKKYLLRYWDRLSLVNWIGVLTLSFL